MNSTIEIQSERADHPQVVALLGALDLYLRELYEPAANLPLFMAKALA